LEQSGEEVLHLEENATPFDVFSEKLRGLAKTEKVGMDRVEELEAFVKRMLGDEAIDPEIELRRTLGVEE
jgi:hypothetical protein